MRKLSPTLRKEFFSLPNILTYVRIGSIPIIIFFLMLSEKALSGKDSKGLCFLAALLFILAAITDYLDGYIARNYQMQTLVGKFVDPVADKMIVLATLVSLVELHRVDAWIVVLILLREMSISGLRTLATAEGLTIDVISVGKYKTTFQLVGISSLVLHYEYALPFLHDPVDFNVIGKTFIIISLFFSFLSAGSYFRKFVTAIIAKYDEMEKSK